jgi:hypothetical protein
LLLHSLDRQPLGRNLAGGAVHADVRHLAQPSADRQVRGLAVERVRLQPVPTPYAGRSVRSLQKPVPAPIIGLQHPLSFYDAFAGGVR